MRGVVRPVRLSILNLFAFIFVFPVLFAFLIEGEVTKARGDYIDAVIMVSAAVVIAVCSLRLAMLSVVRPMPVMRIPFYVFVYIWLGLIPIYQLGLGLVPRSYYVSQETYYEAYFIVLIGIFAYELGGLFVRRGYRSVEIGEGLGATRLWVVGAFSITAVLYIGFIENHYSVLFLPKSEYSEALSDAGGISQKQIQNALLRTPIFLLFLLLTWISSREGWKRRGVNLALVFIFPFFIVANFPLAISRAWFGTIIISFLVLHSIMHPERTRSFFAVALTAGFLTIYPLGTYLRASDVDFKGGVAESIVDTYAAGSFDVFAQIANTLHFLDTNIRPVEYGYQLLGPLFFWVPRSVWSDKPIGSGALVAEGLGFEFANLSSPLWAEGYVNFGLLGVIIFLGGWGWISRWLESSISEGNHLSAARLACVFLSGFQIILLRGDLITSAVMAAPFLIMGVIVVAKFGRVS